MTPRLINGPNGCALEGVIFWFDGTMIRHRGFYTDRTVAERLEALFASHTDDANAQACAEQLREAIRQHDEHWSAQCERLTA